MGFCEFQAVKFSQSREIHRCTRKRQGCTRNRHTSGRGSPPDRSIRLCACGTLCTADWYNERLNLCGGERWITEWNLTQTESPENFVVIFEILPIDKEWKTNEITYRRSWSSCGFNAGQECYSSSWLFSHIDYTLTRSLQLCFVSPNKSRIQFPFHSRSVEDFLNYSVKRGWCCKETKLSIISFELTIISQVFYRVVRFLIQEWNSWDRATFKDNLQASLLTVCCSMRSWESGCNLVASIAAFFCVISKQWIFSGSEGQFMDTGSPGRTVLAQRTSGSFGVVKKVCRWG